LKKILNIYHKYEEIINYLIVGLLTTVVSLATYFVCTSTFLNPQNKIELQIANIISWIFAVTFAYFTNRIFVFKSKSKNIGSQIVSIIFVNIPFSLMEINSFFPHLFLLFRNSLYVNPFIFTTFFCG